MTTPGRDKRIFFAIKIYPHNEFLALFDKIKLQLKDESIRWVKPSNLHVTLDFIGEVSPQQLKSIKESMRGFGGNIEDFKLVISGLGVFRSITYPRVIWSGLENTELLSDIRIEILQRLQKVGMVKEPGKFSPHLTLGRMKRIKDSKRLEMVIRSFTRNRFMEQTVESIVLFESILHPEGPEYVVFQEYFFSKPPDPL